MPAPGDILGHYRVEEFLGEGAFGAVFRGEDIRLGRKVAIKVPHANREEDAGAWGQLLQEARAASALNHPNICATYDIGEDEGVNYIALEFVDGRTLSDVVRSGPLPPSLALDYASQIAKGLAHAHGRGIIHRDLKASNVMISTGGEAKLLDFGLARHLDAATIESVARSRQSLAEIGTTAGTLCYMAPEVLRGKPPGPSSDLWSFGALLHEMLLGRLPFKGETAFELTMAIMVEAPEPLPSTIPGSVRAVVESCMQKEPENRVANAHELLVQLEAARASTEPKPKRARAWQIRVAAAAAFLAVILGLALAWRRHESKPVPPKIEVIQKAALAPGTAPAIPAKPAAAPSASQKRPSTGSHSRPPSGDPNVDVWVNLKTRVYHCPGTRWYKKTADGTLEKQRRAQLDGYHAASNRPCE